VKKKDKIQPTEARHEPIEKDFLDLGTPYTIAGNVPVYHCPFVRGLACERETLSRCLTCEALPPLHHLEEFKTKFVIYKRQLASYLLAERLKRSKENGNR